MIPHRFKVHSFLFNPQVMDNINILIIGVGGIGCELLKVLSKSPINSIHIIDMDTIQMSNLNRQFLFKAEHKGRSKALVAEQSMYKLNPYLTIEAHHKNIRQLPIVFFQKFNFLVMALDNIEARNYVNKIGVRLNIPIIDAGTLAYKGNARIILPKITSCYACSPKSSSQKSYPVCTIRMKPQKPIHCVVWGKMLFQVFFSHNNQQNSESFELKQDGDMDDLSQLTKKEVDQIFQQLFNIQIEQIKSAKTETDNGFSEKYMKKIKSISKQLLQSNNQNINLDEFQDFDSKLSTKNILSNFTRKEKGRGLHNFLESFIDDDQIIYFISSMANLRMQCFSIEDGNLSFNQIKNMAGNIVPAIASTNSIVSGLQVVQMMKYIIYLGDLTVLKSYFIQNQSYKIRGMKIQQPNPQCLVCSKKTIPCIIEIDFNTYLFKNILETIQKYLLDLEQFSINFGASQLYNSQQPNQIILNKKLSELSPSDNTNQIQLILTDQNISQKVCSIWIINSTNSIPILKNQQQLQYRPSKKQQNILPQQKIKKQKQQQNDSDIVQMLEDIVKGNQGDDIVQICIENNKGNFGNNHKLEEQNFINNGKSISNNLNHEDIEDIQDKVQKKQKVQ